MFAVTVYFSFVLNFHTALSCWSEGSYYKWELPLATQFPHAAQYAGGHRLDVSKEKDHLKRQIMVAWDGWTPSPEVQAKWKAWRDAFLKRPNHDAPNKHNKERLKREHVPEKGWPDLPSWRGMGEGNEGVPVPPWAYVPKHDGQETLCQYAPRKGTCKEWIRTWGYNKFIGDCEIYYYTGCGGNRNAFKYYVHCAAKCMVAPTGSCEDDSGIPKDYSPIYDA
ncbi:uncharacterized protein LOC124645478 [Helicoverpa zea]|uniref:uncharacterized protein LOC124645478 n=1 Tax=Helicoverpa zea TaxID=7113 RepID=UPI001F578DE9|nr:uncharacterized protein LOC124645478 [Helicoverpa zea]